MEKIIITIGRQFGSGGRDTGKKLASLFNIPYYDRKLIQRAAEESGLCPELFEKADEKTSGSLLQALAMGFSFNGAIYQPNDYFTDATLFKLQSDVIRQIASEGSCVIVGRCADYILKDDPNCINIFIHSTDEDRIARTMKSLNVTEKEALELMKKTDKTRSSYYNYYTDKLWGYAASYHLCVNSALRGIDDTALWIKNFIENKVSV